MCKFIMKDKQTNDIVLEKKFGDKEKAEGLKSVFEKYLDTSKFQIEIKEKDKK